MGVINRGHNASSDSPDDDKPEDLGHGNIAAESHAHPRGHLHFNDDNVVGEIHERAEKIELLESDEGVYEHLGFSFPTWRKWMILTVIFIVQVSMNFNTSLYSNALVGISHQFNVSQQAARCGAMIFLIFYAFGCELWAPWSEEFGRRPVLQASLFLVNIWQIPVARAPNFATIIICRALGGLSSAGGSVTLGMIADMWEPDVQQYAVAFVIFSSVGGSVLGPVVGGFVEAHLKWQWCIWVQLIFGGAVQLLHFFTVPETRSTILIDRIAQRRRKQAKKEGRDLNIWGPNEITPFKERFELRELLLTFARPFKMFLTEPIVLVLSLLSGFSDALIFVFIQSFGIVYKQWDFGTVEVGLSFLPILVGYFIGYAIFIPAIRMNIRERKAKPDDERAQFEGRLKWLLWTVPCLPIGLFGFAWTSTRLVGGSNLPWIASSVFAAIVGIANYAIYGSTIDYMICAYGPYSASATGGNGWARDFLAGALTLPATPFFENIGGHYHLSYASTILAIISSFLVIAVYVIYWKGPVLRKRSPFAQQLADARAEARSEKPTKGPDGTPLSRRPTYLRANSHARSMQDVRVKQALGQRSAPHSRTNTRPNSAANSRNQSPVRQPIIKDIDEVMDSEETV